VAVVEHKWFVKGLTSAFDKLIDFDSDSIQVALATSLYGPNQITDKFISIIGTNEVTGGGYSRKTLAGKSFLDTTLVWALDAEPTTVWGTSTITARYALIFDGTPGTDATRPMISYVNFQVDQSSSGSDFTLNWDAAGLVKITVV